MELLDKYLWDISECIKKINTYVEQRGRRFDVFANDTCFRDAVQWNIAIIGEAMGHILKLKPDIKITNAKKIVGTRNFVIHGYDSLSPEILWAIVIKDIPLLAKEIVNLKKD